MVWSLFFVIASYQPFGPYEFYEGYTVRPLKAESTHTYDVEKYLLNLTIPMVDSTFSGTVTISARSKIPNLDTVELNMYELDCDEVRVNDTIVDFSYNRRTLKVYLPKTLGSNAPFEVKVKYRGWARRDPINQSYYLGFNYYPKKSGTLDTTVYTVGSPFDAPYWFPCYDHMFDKAQCELYVTVPAGYVVASNGLLQEPVMTGSSLTYHWRTDFPITTYLICVTISKYAQFSDYYIKQSGDTIPIRYYVYTKDTTQAKMRFVNIPDMMDFYSKKFGDYPFEKYGMAEVWPFKYGGMEHQTMTTIHRNWITQGNERGLAHELAHQWWGNCVTALDWPHIWLKEGFATYSEALYTEYKYGRAEFESEMAYYANGFGAYFDSDRSYRHSLYNLPGDKLFIWGLTYCKGAWVLHMLRYVIGDSSFFATFPEYFNRYKYGNATINEYRAVAEAASGQDLGWFFDEWIYDQGHPEYEWQWSSQSHGEDSSSLVVNIKQVQTNAPIFKMPIELQVVTTLNDTTVFQVWDSLAEQTFSFLIGGDVSEVKFDPANRILKKETMLGIGEAVSSLTRGIKISVAPVPAYRTVKFELSLNEPGVFAVYDRTGRRVKSWILQPEDYSLVWHGSDEKGQPLPAGVYFYEWKGAKTRNTGKIILVR